MKKWSSERLLSITAIIISVGTLFTIVFQTELIRKQQYASVLPYLEIWNSTQATSYKLILMNNGIGPAFIKEVKIHFEDTVYNMDPHGFLKEVVLDRDTIQSVYYSNIKKGRLIPAGEVLELIGVADDKENAEKLYNWFSGASGLELEIIYESVYGERWSVRGIANEPTKLN